MVRRILVLLITSLIFSGCDPLAEMEANVENATSKSVTLVFVSSFPELDTVFQVLPNEKVLVQEGFDIGNTYLEPYFTDYDSIFITNSSNEVLKVYKADTPGKNLYNVQDWSSKEPAKWFFIYDFRIEPQDIN